MSYKEETVEEWNSRHLIDGFYYVDSFDGKVKGDIFIYRKDKVRINSLNEEGIVEELVKEDKRGYIYRIVRSNGERIETPYSNLTRLEQTQENASLEKLLKSGAIARAEWRAKEGFKRMLRGPRVDIRCDSMRNPHGNWLE